MGVVIPILSLALSAVTTFAQMGLAKQQYNDQIEVANKQAQAQYEEIVRQQEEVNRIANEQAADRVRQANAELGTVRVAGGERGVSGYTMMTLANHVAYLEGLDISRIRKNQEANLEAGEAAKKAAEIHHFQAVTIAANQYQATKTGAILGFAGSGLNILGDFAQQSAQLTSYKNIY